MISFITAVPPAQPATPAPAGTDSKKAPAPKQESAGNEKTDTVHLSSTARAQLSALQATLEEAVETPAQTASEALNGDPVAQRLLARQTQADQYARLGK